MKTPPFLLFTTLVFWGWQSGFLWLGLAMGAVLELPRISGFRWDLDDADFSRIWGFCTVLNVALVTYVFTNNDAGGLNGMLHGNTAATMAGSGVITTTRFFRWLPMTVFPFIAAQVFNARPSVPLTGISLVLRWRRRKGDDAFSGRYLDVSYPYFLLCVFAAGVRSNSGGTAYFWGLCVLAAWAFWGVRPARHRLAVWMAGLLLVLGQGWLEMAGINQAQRLLQNLNSQWLARFFSPRTDPLQSMTSMGRIGELKLSARIIIRLEPREMGRVPEYLREASYRNFQSPKSAWYSGSSLADFEYLQSETNNTTWVLLPGKRMGAAVSIACYLNGWSRDLEAPEGLLPLPEGCGRLEKVPANMVLRGNKTGAILAVGRGLVIFDAHYGGAATMDSRPDIASTNRLDLSVPANELPALDQIIAEASLSPGMRPLEAQRVLARFFFDNFSYSTWQGRDKEATAEKTPLSRFLLTSRTGHCEYFASATVLLLRRLGIPARYAVGYYVHETRGSGYVVRERDAHAWCLVWDGEAERWVNFDTTPPSWVAEESKRRGADWFSDFGSWIRFQISKIRWGQAHLQQYIFWSLIPVLLVLLYHILFRRLGRLRAGNRAAPLRQELWPGLDSEFYRLEAKLAALGVPRQPDESLATWLERCTSAPALADCREPLRGLLRLHYRHRFDPRGLDGPDRARLRAGVLALLDQIPPSRI